MQPVNHQYDFIREHINQYTRLRYFALVFINDLFQFIQVMNWYTSGERTDFYLSCIELNSVFLIKIFI